MRNISQLDGSMILARNESRASIASNESSHDARNESRIASNESRLASNETRDSDLPLSGPVYGARCQSSQGAK